MYQKIYRDDFHRAFADFNRSDNFSYEAKEALFDYLESLETNDGQSIELDVIALCCEYTEDNIKNALKQYNLESLDDLKDYLLVIWHDDINVLYQLI